MIRWIIVRSQPPNKVVFDVNTIPGKIRCSFEEKLNERPWMPASFSFRRNAASIFLSRAFLKNREHPLFVNEIRLEKTRKRERSNDFELIDRADCTRWNVQWNWIFQSYMHTWVHSLRFFVICCKMVRGGRGKLRDPISSIRATISRLCLSIRSD